MTANGQGVFLWEDETVQELGVVTVAQHCECNALNAAQLYAFKWLKWYFLGSVYFAIKQKPPRRKKRACCGLRTDRLGRLVSGGWQRMRLETGGGLSGGRGGLGRSLRFILVQWEAIGRFRAGEQRDGPLCSEGP